MKSNTKGAFLVSLCMFLRSTDVFFRKTSLLIFPPLVLVMMEHLIGSLFLLPRIKKIRSVFKLSFSEKISLAFVACGTSVGGVLCFTHAFNYMNPAIVILLQKLQPVVTILLSFFILGERPRRFFWPLAPVIIISGYVLSFGLKSPLNLRGTIEFYGVLFSLLSVLFWGAGAVFGKKLLQKINYLDLVTVRYIGGFLFTLILLFVLDNRFVVAPLKNYLPIIYMALVPGLLALVFYYKGLSHISATLSSLLELLFPLSSALIVWFFLGVKMTVVQIIAAVILLFCVTLLSLLKPVR
ncbi:MAG: DMT family transporter [Bacteriovoracaceae bacterium]|nr:DMT family transporter [Bacteriovoracaceae bacterium]